MQFLLADSGLGGLMSALGINWSVLLLNGLAFLVVVAIMGKFVYPPLMRALDAKQAELEAGTRLKQEAEARLQQAKTEAAAAVRQARSSAEEIVALAKTEAAELTQTAEQRATARAERLAAEAREQLDRDVMAARVALKAETARLVVAAAEEILAQKLDSQADAALVQRSLEEVGR